MKKGFTLIELLAVIVILAIIALIAIPIVLNIIKDTKENAILRSVELYLDSVELSVARNQLKGKIEDGIYSINENGNLCIETLDNLCENEIKIDIKNKKAYVGSKIEIISNKISYDGTILKSDNYTCFKENNLHCLNKDVDVISTLENSLRVDVIGDTKNLYDYKIYGNSITTALSNEIESVGNKTNNIADLSKAITATTTQHVKFNYDNMTGTLEYTSKPTQYDYIMLNPEKDIGFKFEEGKTYYYGADVTVSGKQTNELTSVLFGISYTGFTIPINYFMKNETRHINGTFIYTGQETIRLMMHANYGSIEPAQVRFDNIYFGEVNKFEPCGKYKIPINILKNGLLELKEGFSPGNYINYTSENQVITKNVLANVGTSYLLQIEAFDEFIGDFKLNAGTYIWGLVDVSGTPKITNPYIVLTTSTETINWNANTPIILTEEATITQVRSDLLSYTKGDTQQFRIQIDEGNTLISSSIANIYLEEPLRKVGDYVDYIDFINKKVVRNVEVTNENTLQGLSTPKVDDIELPAIELNKGINYLEIDTNVKPSKTIIKYYK